MCDVFHEIALLYRKITETASMTIKESANYLYYLTAHITYKEYLDTLNIPANIE